MWTKNSINIEIKYLFNFTAYFHVLGTFHASSLSTFKSRIFCGMCENSFIFLVICFIKCLLFTPPYIFHLSTHLTDPICHFCKKGFIAIASN